MKKIQSALISVYHKENLEPLVKLLHSLNVTIHSTGGTQKHIEAMDIPVMAVEDLTSYPSILGGRVKTLHPKIFGGILARRNNQSDLDEMQQFQIPVIDLVIVDLYPFEQTVANTDDEQEIIEKIDIGGIALIRAAAKNFKDTLVVSHQGQYMKLLELLLKQHGEISEAQRKQFAMEAFAVSSNYDTAIHNYFNRDFGVENLKLSYNEGRTLRYGENPHQQGVFYGNLDGYFEQLHGKELSYNNLVDIDGAINLVAEFEETVFIIIKHTNSCGLAVRDNLKEAYLAALAGDPISAFGGILCTNKTVDAETAEEIHKLFFEILIAPDFTEEALEILKQKKNRRLLKQLDKSLPNKVVKTSINGFLVQERDASMETADDFKVVTNNAPTAQQLEDLVFANKAVKHLKSNTIVFAKNKQLIGMGCGQTSRIDALKQGAEKAIRLGFSLKGAVMASDAFFPFPDCVEEAHKHGVVAVIQPGGSIKDQASIDACNNANMSMVVTGTRHFKH